VVANTPGLGQNYLNGKIALREMAFSSLQAEIENQQTANWAYVFYTDQKWSLLI